MGELEDEVALVRAVEERGELDERVRLRIALDLLDGAEADAGSVHFRSAESRLRVEWIAVGLRGQARILREGDATGAGVVVWEVLAGRTAPEGALGRVHELVDEIHPDVDDAVAAALHGSYPSIGSFREALEAAADGRVATHEEVLRALGPIALAAAPATRVPEPGTARACPRVLVVSSTATEDDELPRGLRAVGFEVVLVDSARGGFEGICRLRPACVVCDNDLRDDGGDRLVLRMRRLAPPVSTTPFVLLASHGSTSERAARFSSGADVCLLKPFKASNVILQVLGLHQMSERLRRARTALSRFPQASSSTFQGSLEQISLASILTLVDMEHRTGVFSVGDESRCADLAIIQGHVIHGFIDGQLVHALEAMRAVVGIRSGRFSFSAKSGVFAVPDDAIRVGHALAEATRLADEAAVIR